MEKNNHTTIYYVTTINSQTVITYVSVTKTVRPGLLRWYLVLQVTECYCHFFIEFVIIRFYLCFRLFVWILYSQCTWCWFVCIYASTCIKAESQTEMENTFALWNTHTVFQKSDTKIEITITTTNLIRIRYPLSSFSYHLSGVNRAVDFVEICNICAKKAIIKVAKRKINSDKICRSYSDLNFGVTFFGTQCM